MQRTVWMQEWLLINCFHTQHEANRCTNKGIILFTCSRLLGGKGSELLMVNSARNVLRRQSLDMQQGGSLTTAYTCQTHFGSKGVINWPMLTLSWTLYSKVLTPTFLPFVPFNFCSPLDPIRNASCENSAVSSNKINYLAIQEADKIQDVQQSGWELTSCDANHIQPWDSTLSLLLFKSGTRRNWDHLGSNKHNPHARRPAC